MSKQKRKYIVILGWVSIIIISGILLNNYDLTNRENMLFIIEQIKSTGIIAVIIFLFAFVIRSLLIIPITPLLLAAGLIFDALLGFTLSMIGILISANLSFLIGRYIKGDSALTEKKIVKKIDSQIKNNGFLAMLTLRMSGIPFDMCNYISAATSARHKDFIIATLIGMIPSTLLVVYMGENVLKNTKLFVILALIPIILITILFIKKRFTKPIETIAIDEE